MMTVLKNFGIPTGRGDVKYPWSALEVGDAFIIPSESEKSVRNAAAFRSRKVGQKFAIRKYDDKRHVVVRVA